MLLLAESWPRDVRALQRAFTRRYGKSLSYQAIHRALASLCEHGVAARTASRYRLSTAWLERLQAFAKDTHQRYHQSLPRPASPAAPFQAHAVASTLSEAKRLMLRFLQHALTCRAGPLAVYNRYAFAPLLLAEEAFPTLERLRLPSGSLLATLEGNATARACAAFWARHGVRHLPCPRPLASFDFAVCGDHVTLLFYPRPALRALDQWLSPSALPEQALPELLAYVLQARVLVPFLALEAPSLAAQLRALVARAVRAGAGSKAPGREHAGAGASTLLAPTQCRSRP